MSRAGASLFVRVLGALWYWGSGRPMRWLVTIAGELLFFSFASATNSSAVRTKPATARNARGHCRIFKRRTLYAGASYFASTLDAPIWRTTQFLSHHSPRKRVRATPKIVVSRQAALIALTFRQAIDLACWCDNSRAHQPFQGLVLLPLGAFELPPTLLPMIADISAAPMDGRFRG